MDLSSGVGVLAFFLIIPGVLALMLWLAHQRHQAVTRWAASIGWRYIGSDPSLVHRWRGQPFGVGDSRHVSELVAGTFQGRPAMSFAYKYTTGSGKNRTTSTFHVIAISLPTLLPTLGLTPDGIGAKLAKVVGGQDIQFESHDFNAAWRVEARDQKFAHDMISPRLMERLLRPDARGMSIRVEGQDILCWTRGTPVLDRVGGRLEVLCAIADAVPRFVWLDHGYDPGKP